MSLAEKFAELFAGLDRSHGRYQVPPGARPNDKGKLHDPSWARTVHGPVTVELWEAHLRGDLGLGVVPIRDDATCVFGAIDVDQYRPPLDYVGLIAEVRRFGLPLVACRTKSGAVHLYLFLTGPAPAELVRRRLLEWSVLIGRPGVEVFPKQTRLASARDDGSWINAPYQAGRRTVRYALRDDGSAMSPEEFVEAARAAAVSPGALADFEPLTPAGDDAEELFADGPPCLQTLARRGFGDWQNNGLVNVVVYLKSRFGEDWERHVDRYNQRLMNPPVPSSEVAAMLKTSRRKNYRYMCKQEPICSVCDRRVCLTREHGVGGGGDDPGVVFGELVKLQTDPPVYFWDVDGARIELSVADLMDQRRFQALVIAKLDKWPNLVKPSLWQRIVREKLSAVTRLSVPEDATKEGQFWSHLQRFCTSRVKGRSMDEILMGKPYTSGDGRTYFCSTDLLTYLTQHRFNGVNEKDVFRWLRARGVDHHQKNLKGKFVNCWSVPAFSEQSEEFDVPRAKEEERM